MTTQTDKQTFIYTRMASHKYDEFLVPGEEFHVHDGTLVESLKLLPVKAIRAEIGEPADYSDLSEYNDRLFLMGRKSSISLTAWPPELQIPRGVMRMKLEEVLSDNRGFKFSVISVG